MIAWLNDQFPLQNREGSQIYLGFFNSLKTLDMALHKLTDKERLHYLGESDAAEIALRQISSYIHEKRSGDTVAAMGMLAIKPSGAKVDIAPAWLIEEGAGLSQQEFKRRQRAKASGTQTGKADAKGGKGQGKLSTKSEKKKNT